MRLRQIYSRFFQLLVLALLTNQFVQFGASANPSTSKPANSPTNSTKENSPKALVEQVWQSVDNKYIDRTFNGQDWNAIRQRYLNRSYGSYEEAYQAIREMLKLLDNLYTTFYDPDQYKNLQGSRDVAGIGIRLASDEKTRSITVIQPIENSPAQRVGLLPKDIITTIDGKSVEKIDVNTVVQLLRGKAGTSVTLGVLRNGQPITFQVQRAKIEFPALQYYSEETTGGRVGYIHIIQFSAKANQEMKAAIENLEKQNVKGYVIDIRSNVGGLLRVSIDITRMWLSKGVIINTVDRDGKREQQLANNSALTQKPLVVLVNNGSASASEVLAAALQENQRAILVGTKTFGNNLIQLVQALQNETGLAVTTQKWLTPKGKDINHRGLNPDVFVDLDYNQEKKLQDILDERSKISPMTDPQFAKALEMLNRDIQRIPRP